MWNLFNLVWLTLVIVSFFGKECRDFFCFGHGCVFFCEFICYNSLCERCLGSGSMAAFLDFRPEISWAPLTLTTAWWGYGTRILLWRSRGNLPRTTEYWQRAQKPESLWALIQSPCCCPPGDLFLSCQQCCEDEMRQADWTALCSGCRICSIVRVFSFKFEKQEHRTCLILARRPWS